LGLVESMDSVFLRHEFQLGSQCHLSERYLRYYHWHLRAAKRGLWHNRRRQKEHLFHLRPQQVYRKCTFILLFSSTAIQRKVSMLIIMRIITSGTTYTSSFTCKSRIRLNSTEPSRTFINAYKTKTWCGSHSTNRFDCSRLWRRESRSHRRWSWGMNSKKTNLTWRFWSA